MNSLFKTIAVSEEDVRKVFQKYGVVSEHPIDYKEFAKEIGNCVYLVHYNDDNITHTEPLPAYNLPTAWY